MKKIISRLRSTILLFVFLMMGSLASAAMGDGIIIMSPVAATTESEASERDEAERRAAGEGGKADAIV